MDSTKYYHYPQEVWDKEKCEKVAKRTWKNLAPFKGYMGCSQTHLSEFGTHRLNGGTVINGEWYPGIVKPLPVVHEDFEIVHVPTWGWRLKRR